ncbi:auxin efflux carrier [Pseudomonas putida LS46]|nr:auxin efflux carrier [Pseudomonas putida LS46]
MGLAEPVLHFLDMLVLATTPCGLGIAGCIPGRKRAGAQASSWPLVGLKLVGQPALTWVLAYKVFSLPTGTGPFMLGEYSNLEAGLISRTILLSPMASLVTLTGLLYLLGYAE